MGFRVGTELQHAARHVNCAFDLVAGSQLRRVTNVDNDNIALAHPVSEIGGLNPRHGGIGSSQHILHTRRHGFTPVFPRSYGADRPFLSGSVISQDLPNGFKVRGCVASRKTSKRALESQD